MIKYLLTVMAVGLLISGSVALASGEAKSLIQNLHLFDGYIGEEKGIDVALPAGENEAKIVKFDIAQFYKDILKVSDTPEVINACREQQDKSFQECVKEKATDQQKIRYEWKMRQMRDAVALMKKHGGQVDEIPFVKDLMSE